MPTTRTSPAVQAVAELDDLNLKLARGQRMLQRLKDEDVQIATADKEVVFREDKTTLYRYKSSAKRTIGVPVLVAYGQVGRYTMTDLQEDRSMLRNLLALGKFLGTLNPEPMSRVAKEACTALETHQTEQQPPTLWQLFRRLGHPDTRRGLSLLIGIVTGIGRASYLGRT